LKALTEIEGMLKYLDKAENEINTAEPISIDPEILTVQLKDHHVSIKDIFCEYCYIQCNLSKWNLLGTNFSVQNRQVFF